MNLTGELAGIDDVIDLKAQEQAFVQSAAGYSARKGISYAAWREAGIDATVLKRAGIARTRG